MKAVFVKKILPLLIFIALSASSSELAATWVREQGRSLLYIDLSYRSSDEYYVQDERMNANNFSELNFNIYTDWGVTDRYTIGLYIPALRVLSIEETDTAPEVSHRDIGDIDLIQRLQLLEGGGAVFNAEFLVGMPTGDAFSGGSGREHGLYAGDDEFNFMPGFSLAAGFTLLSLPSYATFSTGINLRNKQFSHELHSSFQWGLFIYKKSLLLSLELKRQQSLKTEEEDTTEDGLWNNTSYTVYGRGITVKFSEDSGLSLLYKTLWDVENSLAGDIYSLAVFTIF